MMQGCGNVYLYGAISELSWARLPVLLNFLWDHSVVETVHAGECIGLEHNVLKHVQTQVGHCR